MHKAIGLGEKDGLQCFALLIRYDSSVILGSYSKLVSWSPELVLHYCNNKIIIIMSICDVSYNYFAGNSRLGQEHQLGH